MKVQIPMFLYQLDWGHGGERKWCLYSMGDMGDDWHTLVGPVTVEVEAPDNFDPRPAKIAALEAEKAKIRAEFAARVTAIERRISELQALTCEVA